MPNSRPRRAERRAATIGPLIPTFGAQASVYGLGGGIGDDRGNFGDGQDYYVGLSWRIGPGGLFDPGRRRGASARERQSSLERQRMLDQVPREVVEAHVRVRSLAEQWEISRHALEVAAMTLQLSQERRNFGVASVLETLQAEEDLTEARLAYLDLIASANRAQLELQRAIGAPLGPALSSTTSTPSSAGFSDEAR